MNLALAAAPVAVPAAAAAPAPAPVAPQPDAPLVDDSLVPGLRLPKVPGLPGADTPGIGLGDLLAPPSPDSLAGKAELAVVKGIQELRTPEGDAWAVKMAEQGATGMWFDFAKRHRAQTGKVAGWLDTALLAGVIAATAGVTQIGKERYDRLRPFVVDPTIKPPVKLPHADTSYPSGHASSAFAAARVISVLEPKLAKEAYQLATQVAVSRVYAGVHFPSDVIAGALLGTGVAEAMLRKAGKRPSLAPEA